MSPRDPGFALQSDNLIPYAGEGPILHTIAALIILGGISPFLVVRFPAVAAGRPARAEEKLVLVATAVLLVSGTLLFAVLEWNASLRSLSPLHKLSNAWLQSVTLRTAGFNSVDLGQITPPTMTFMLLFMFIGGSPGGTAGGIKTTTAAVLVLAVVSTVRGLPIAEVFHRRIPHSTAYRAAAIATVGAASVFVAFMALLLTQRMPGGIALFEVVVAVRRVGAPAAVSPAPGEPLKADDILVVVSAPGAIAKLMERV